MEASGTGGKFHTHKLRLSPLPSSATSVCVGGGGGGCHLFCFFGLFSLWATPHCAVSSCCGIRNHSWKAQLGVDGDHSGGQYSGTQSSCKASTLLLPTGLSLGPLILPHPISGTLLIPPLPLLPPHPPSVPSLFSLCPSSILPLSLLHRCGLCPGKALSIHSCPQMFSGWHLLSDSSSEMHLLL